MQFFYYADKTIQKWKLLEYFGFLVYYGELLVEVAAEEEIIFFSLVPKVVSG